MKTTSDYDNIWIRLLLIIICGSTHNVYSVLFFFFLFSFFSFYFFLTKSWAMVPTNFVIGLGPGTLVVAFLRKY